MLDLPIQDVQVVHEYIMTDIEKKQVANEEYYQMSEIDLSFCDALASTCSGEASSGSGGTPTPLPLRKT